MLRKLFEKLILFTLVTTICWSCSPERKLANEFSKEGVKRSALLFVPQLIFKTNLNKDILDSIFVEDESKEDSVLLANSVLLNEINDSLFIANYVLGMKRELKLFNFTIYTEDRIADFMEIDSNAYVIHIAQIEIEESEYPVRDETIMNNTYYYHDHILGAETINTWFEISEVNNDENGQQVYFASDAITDELDGQFTYDYFGGSLKYLYEVDSLKPTDLYNFAYLLGRTYAGYTFDLLLNKHLKANLPEEKQSGKYYRYDPELGSFFPTEEDKFIPLD